MKNLAIAAAFDAMNRPTWTGYSPIELVKAGRITDYAATAQHMLDDCRKNFGCGDDIGQYLSDCTAFKNTCISMMQSANK